MDQKLQRIIGKNAYLNRLIDRIPEELLSFFLERIERVISEDSGEVIHLKLEQKEEYMNFVTPLEGMEIQEYCISDMDKIPGYSKSSAEEGVLVIHYCNRGIAEIHLNEEKYAYMQPGVLCIEWRQEAGKVFEFFDETYGGLEMIFRLDYISDSDEEMLKRLGVNLDAMRDAYDRNEQYYIGRCPDKLRNTFDELAEIMRDGKQDKTTYLLTALLALNRIRTEELSIEEQQFYLTRGQRQMVKEIHDSAIKRLAKDISMEEWEQQFHVSSVSLNKYFSIVYGTTIKRYVQDARMRMAAEKLKTGTNSIADIALSVGYTSQSKFGTVFKRKYGYTPLEYRRLYGGK